MNTSKERQTDQNNEVLFADEDNDEVLFANEDNDEVLFTDENHDEVLFAEEESKAQNEPQNGITAEKTGSQPNTQDAWKIFIVDDDVEVHHVTKMMLRKIRFENKGLTFISAYSAAEAKIVVQKHQDIAMIFLDVVMEEDDAGLKFVKYLRDEIKNRLVRIVLRTGQPGMAPEEDIIIKYDINDYKEKGELTAKKMLTTVFSTLRSFRDLTTNECLKTENVRMKAELDIAHRIQQMALPLKSELNKIKELDIACFMEPANEVGGDYYEVLCHDGHIKIGIGDVTGHGLESGILMLVVQIAVQSLLESGIKDSENFLNILNRIIYNSVHRMKLDKNLTLSLLDYHEGVLQLTGQHEDVLLVRKSGQIERVDTFDLGFMVGVVPNIAHIVSHFEIQLQPGDGIVLYTDGITEALNPEMEHYEIERLCNVVSQSWHLTAQEIQQAVVADVKQYIDTQEVFDDITLLVLKQK
ncbi:MAG: SpoIIE family protein phosphatase [Candidatus Parabeggiatoa sp.]|nr:SpoIIE family protein phosphatase [Candidatus Parabeggiatoa sp.]